MSTRHSAPRSYSCQCGSSCHIEHRSPNCFPECRKRWADSIIRRFTPMPKIDWLWSVTGVPFDDRKMWDWTMRSLRGRWELTAGGIVIPGGVEPRSIEYARFLERGELHGAPHYHLLIRGDLPSQHHTSNLLKHFGYGFITDIRRVTDPEGIRGYLLNYLTKASGWEGRRKIAYSKNFWEKIYKPYVDLIPESKGGPHVHHWR